jgi:serine/threonine protein kinase
MDAIQWFKIKFLGRGSYGTVHLPKSRNRYGSSWLMAVKFAAIERSFSLMKEAQILQEFVNCPEVVRGLGFDVTYP